MLTVSLSSDSSDTEAADWPVFHNQSFSAPRVKCVTFCALQIEVDDGAPQLDHGINFNRHKTIEDLFQDLSLTQKVRIMQLICQICKMPYAENDLISINHCLNKDNLFLV